MHGRTISATAAASWSRSPAAAAAELDALPLACAAQSSRTSTGSAAVHTARGSTAGSSRPRSAGAAAGSSARKHLARPSGATSPPPPPDQQRGSSADSCSTTAHPTRPPLERGAESADAPLARAFTQYVATVHARDPELAAALSHYVLTLDRGPIGMVLELERPPPGAADPPPAAAAAVVVAELRSDEAGRPLQALAAGAVSLGDVLVAVNGVPLGAGGPAALDAVAVAFKTAPRPLTLLLRRRRR